MSDTEEPTDQQSALKSAANSYARQRGHFTTAVKNSRAAFDVSEEHAKKPVFYEAIVKSLEKIEVQYQKVLAALDKYVSLEPPQDKANVLSSASLKSLTFITSFYSSSKRPLQPTKVMSVKMEAATQEAMAMTMQM